MQEDIDKINTSTYKYYNYLGKISRYLSSIPSNDHKTMRERNTLDKSRQKPIRHCSSVVRCPKGKVNSRCRTNRKTRNKHVSNKACNLRRERCRYDEDKDPSFKSITQADWSAMSLYGDGSTEFTYPNDEMIEHQNDNKGSQNSELVNNQPSDRQQSCMEKSSDSELPVNQSDWHYSGMRAEMTTNLPNEDSIEINSCHVEQESPDTKHFHRKKQGLWMSNVNFNDKVQYRYSLERSSEKDILKTDLEWLNRVNQPSAVLDQLGIGQSSFQHGPGYGNDKEFDFESFERFYKGLFFNGIH